MTRLSSFAGCSALLVLAACSTEPPAPQSQLPPGATPPATVSPRSVRLQLAGGAARSARVPLTGGTLTATGEDGTRFSLEIPDGALVQETEITLTPVTAVEGLPFSRGLGGAVQLAPDGLRLYAHATLTIAPARPIPAAEQAFFGWAGEGRDFHLEPSRDGVTLKLLHFSGYGVAGAAPGEVTAQARSIPLDVEARLAQEVAILVAEERNRQLVGDSSGTAEFNRRMQEAMTRYAEEVLRPLSQVQPRTCAEGAAQIERIFLYDRTRQLMGTDAPAWFDGLLMQAFQGEIYQRAAHRCFDEAYERCVSSGDLPGMLQAIISHERWRQLLGGEGQPDPYGTQKMEECRNQLQGGGGASAWSGKVTIDLVGTDNQPRQQGETRSRVSKVHYDLSVTGVEGQVGEYVVLTATLDGTFEEVDEYNVNVNETVMCTDNGRTDTRILRANGRTTASGNITGKPQKINLHFELGQTYELSVSPPKIPFASSTISYLFHKGACNPFNDSESTNTTSGWGNAGGERVEATGFAQSLEAEVLTGTHSEDRLVGGLPTKITVGWTLRRGPAK